MYSGTRIAALFQEWEQELLYVQLWSQGHLVLIRTVIHVKFMGPNKFGHWSGLCSILARNWAECWTGVCVFVVTVAWRAVVSIFQRSGCGNSGCGCSWDWFQRKNASSRWKGKTMFAYQLPCLHLYKCDCPYMRKIGNESETLLPNSSLNQSPTSIGTTTCLNRRKSYCLC